MLSGGPIMQMNSESNPAFTALTLHHLPSSYCPRYVICMHRNTNGSIHNIIKSDVDKPISTTHLLLASTCCSLIRVCCFFNYSSPSSSVPPTRLTTDLKRRYVVNRRTFCMQIWRDIAEECRDGEWLGTPGYERNVIGILHDRSRRTTSWQ